MHYFINKSLKIAMLCLLSASQPPLTIDVGEVKLYDLANYGFSN